jgi:hypothetical protein
MRFAAHHVPETPRRGFWVRCGLVFLLLAVPVAAVNLIVDPFDFRLVPHLLLDRAGIVRKNDTMLWTAGELRRIPQSTLDRVTIAVAGDSRTDTLCRWPSSPRVFKLGADCVINLSVGGASMADNIKLLEVELPLLPRLRAVLLGAPIERVAPPGIDRADNALKLANHPVLYALGLGTFASSAELLLEQRVWTKRPAWAPPFDKNAHLADATAEGLDVAGALARAGKTASTPLSKSEREAAAGWKATLLRTDPERLRKRTHDLLAPLAARLRDRGIRLVFFFPPLHPDVRGGIEPRIAELQRPYVAELARLGTVENFSLGNGSGITPVFTDSMHLQQDVAHAVFADIYLRDLAPPAGRP